jgi:hypothetical protein
MISRHQDDANPSPNVPITSNGSAAWDPHSLYSLAVVCGDGISVVDTREMEIVQKKAHAHRGNIRLVTSEK